MILIQETAQAHAVAMLVIAERAAVITEARTWIGTRFHHNAAVKGSGVDCARLVAAVYTDCGVISAQSIAYYDSQAPFRRGDADGAESPGDAFDADL